MVIKEFNKKNLRSLADEINEAVKKIGAKYGLEFAPKGGSYVENEWTYKGILKTTGAKKDEDEANARSGRLLGFAPDAIGKTFIFRGRKHRITGFDLKKRVYPVKAVRVEDNVPFRFADDLIKSLIK